MAKILVVDDESDLELLIRQKFRKKIKANEYEFLFAQNGVQALVVLENNSDVDIVLSDINMPEMDGLTLLSRIAELAPLIKSVIVSAYGDMDNIRTAMNRGAFDFITKPINFEDLFITMEKTLEHVYQTKKTLLAIRQNNILKMYVDDSVLNFMDTSDYESKITATETIVGTVLFIDICSFTSISETASPETVVNLLNEYFDVMVKEIIANDGYVDKFIGDAVMAVYRGEGHLERAIKTALAVRILINELPPFKETLTYEPHVSIGIKSGEMISGNIGSSTLKRLDYTVLGDTVNTAHRLQSFAQDNQIAIGESCYEKVKDKFSCKEIADVKLRNKSEVMKVYEVIE